LKVFRIAYTEAGLSRCAPPNRRECQAPIPLSFLCMLASARMSGGQSLAGPQLLRVRGSALSQRITICQTSGLPSLQSAYDTSIRQHPSHLTIVHATLDGHLTEEMYSANLAASGLGSTSEERKEGSTCDSGRRTPRLTRRNVGSGERFFEKS